MAMTMKEKLLFLWILVAVAVSFAISHFWGFAVYVLENAVALSFVSLPSLAKFAAGICGIQLLP
jgi:hypothetical protein